ncbi:MAG: hypothetical protein AAGI01_15755 [Myxococcota bacterium]
MNFDDVFEQIQDTLRSVFRRGSRHQVEKLLVVVVYLLLCAASMAWGLSGSSAANELGARFGKELIEEIDRSIYFLENHSDEDWTSVRVVLNKQYLFKADKLEASKRKTLAPQDFTYFYYIPRAWGVSDWERLEAGTQKPGEKAPSTLTPHLVEVSAEQGRIKIMESEFIGASAPATP